MSKEEEAKGENSSKEKAETTLEKIRDYSEDQFDKLMVYLSAGGIVLTIGFVKDIVDLNKAIFIACLFISWFCFPISLLMILLSQRTIVIAIDALSEQKYDKVRRYDKITKFLNWSSMISLVIGILFFVIFACINVIKDKNIMSKKNDAPKSQANDIKSVTNVGKVEVQGAKTLPASVITSIPGKNDGDKK